MCKKSVKSYIKKGAKTDPKNYRPISVLNKYKEKSLSFLGPKTWSIKTPSIKNVKTSPSFMQALKKNILLQMQT